MSTDDAVSNPVASQVEIAGHFPRWDRPQLTADLIINGLTEASRRTAYGRHGALLHKGSLEWA